MQKLLLIGAALAFTAASLPVLAYDEVPSLPAYVEADIGHASLDRSGISPTLAETSGISGTTVTGSLLSGYFFTDNFGAELGYHDFGTPGAFFRTGPVETVCPSTGFPCPKVTGPSASLLGKIEVVPNLDGILRLGLLYWHVGSSGPIPLLDKTNGQAFLYGIGVRRRFEGGWGLVITYEQSNFSTEETRIGLSYSF